MKALKFLKVIKEETPDDLECNELDEAIEEIEKLEARSCNNCNFYIKERCKNENSYCENIHIITDVFSCSEWEEKNDKMD